MRVLLGAFAALALLIGGSFGAYRYAVHLVQDPAAADSRPVSVEITPGESAAEVAKDLAAQGVVRSALAFQLYLRYTGGAAELRPGRHLVRRNMTMQQVAQELTRSEARPVVTITLPEGLTAREMDARVAAAGLGAPGDYIAASRDPSISRPFLASRPPAAGLEGFLFPDTYEVQVGVGPRALIEKQLDRFGQVLTSDLQARLSQPDATRPAITVFQLVILASIVEREADRDLDRPRVCSVYFNRLKQNMPLQADATVEYALGVWKPSLTLEDLKIDSPYNTYRHRGLPPGPISNPGEAALKACVNPERTDYLYYFTDHQGITRFATTLDQFEQLKAKYGVSGN